MEHLLAVLAGSAISSFLNWITVKLQTSQQTTQLAAQLKDVQHLVATQAVTLPTQVVSDVTKAIQSAPTPSPSDIKL